MKVLIVDDERLIAEDIQLEVNKLFPDANSQMSTSSTKALKMAEAESFDVALLDIDMPGMDGLTLAKKLIALQPMINIIFITGHQNFAMEAHELYCSAFLLKPVGEKKLREAFAHVRKPFVDISEDLILEHYQGHDVLGKKLKAYRKLRGISRQELADLMDVTRQTVFRWEHGERMPDILTFLHWTRLLGVDLEELLELEGKQE